MADASRVSRRVVASSETFAVNRAVVAPSRHRATSHLRVSSEVAGAPVSDVALPALNLLCLWFVSQLFFNEKTTFLTLNALAKIRPDRLVFVVLVVYVLLSGKRQLKRLKISKEEIMMLWFFGFLSASCLVSVEVFLNYHLNTVFTFIGFPMFTFWLCRRLPFRPSNITRFALVMIAIGGYLGLCGVVEHYDWPHFIYPD